MSTFIRTLIISLVILTVGTGLRRWIQGMPDLEPGENVLSYSFRSQVMPQPFLPSQKEAPLKVPSEDLVGEVSKPSLPETNDEIASTAGRLDGESSVYVAKINRPAELLYVIEPGDRLDKISMKFYQTHHRHRDILAANPGLNPKRMTPGMSIIIPDLKEPLPKAQEVSFSMPASGKRVYRVRSGDVLSVISERELGSVRYQSKILEMNPGLKAGKLKVGQALNLPVGVMASSH